MRRQARLELRLRFGTFAHSARQGRAEPAARHDRALCARMRAMKLTRLALSTSGAVAATFVTEVGRERTVEFTTSTHASSGITSASPSDDLFSNPGFSVDEVRRIVSAVVAFERAAGS